MSYGSNGSVIGPDNVPTASAAAGVWSMGEIAEARRDDIWPMPDAISMFGFFKPSGLTATSSACVLETDSSGNLFWLIPLGAGDNYVVEVNKTTLAVDSIQNYEQAGGQDMTMYCMGISQSTDVMYLFGTAWSGSGSLTYTQAARLTKSGSNGYDTFSGWGNSSAGYKGGTMATYPTNYVNRYIDKGQRFQVDDTKGVVYAGGRWWTSYSYGRVLAIDDSATYANRGYAFFGSAYGTYSVQCLGVLGRKSATSGKAYALIMEGYTPYYVWLYQFNESDNSDTDGDRAISLGYKTRSNWKGEGRVTASCDSMDSSENMYIASSGTSQEGYITKFDNSSGLTHQWDIKWVTPWTSSIYPCQSGPVLDAAGNVYCAWNTSSADATHKGGIYVGKWNSSGVQQWMNLLEIHDANESDLNQMIFSCDIKVGTTDSADDSLWLTTGQIYWNSGSTGYSDDKMLCRLRTDGGGQGTYNFTMTGPQGGAYSITYATFAGTTSAGGATDPGGTPPPGVNFGNSYGSTSDNTEGTTQITSGTTWETA